MDAEDRKLFAESLRRATELHTGTALDAALDDLGWREALESDPQDAVALLFELQGMANASSSALDEVLAWRLGMNPATTAVVLPELGKTTPPSAVSGDGCLVRGVATAALQQRENVAIAGSDGQTVMSAASRGVGGRAAHGMDPALGLVAVSVEIPLAPTSSGNWQDATAWAQVALAHELIGSARTMLRLAREHALQRIQFGRPIAHFQAVRHRLAESLVAIEGASAAADAAWEARLSPEAAMLAKALAGQAARTVGRHAQQVLGGMGFTTDHSLHRYVRRTLVLDQLFGSSRRLFSVVGAQLLDTRRLPGLLPL